MRIFRSGYRDLPGFVLRRADRLAGEVNPLLMIVAIGLAVLNLLCLAQRFVDSLPPVLAQIGTGAP